MASAALPISKTTQRRFILGRQGLWLGRRWGGPDGVTQAIRSLELLQLDPLNIVARSQDIALYGRVLDYRASQLHRAAYDQRRFFDYGGWLCLYPIEELPHWRHHMHARKTRPYWLEVAKAHPQAIADVRRELETNGPLGNRAFSGTKRIRSYRGRKDTSLALYYLWITGEVMIHHRDGFERVYDLAERVAPPDLLQASPLEAAEAHFAAKAVAEVGLARMRPWITAMSEYLQRPIDLAEGKAWFQRLIDRGQVFPVQVEGEKELRYALAGDRADLETIAGGGVPAGWAPLDGTTLDEAVFLAPLDMVSARGRAKKLFDFDYVWEVYKPLAQRRWGYYTLPLLYGDRLVGRMDPRLDRATGALIVNGFWLEPDAPRDDPAFRSAVRRGLERFAAFLEAQCIDLSAVQPDELRSWLDGR